MERRAAPRQATPPDAGRRRGRRRGAGAAPEQAEDGDGGGGAGLVPMLECGGCLRGFHLDCLDPPLAAVPKARTLPCAGAGEGLKHCLHHLGVCRESLSTASAAATKRLVPRPWQYACF